jgi:hypothetical protein
MRSLMVKRVAVATAALGLAGFGLAFVPATASAAPDDLAKVTICVDSSSDYSVSLQAPDGGSTSTQSPGTCSAQYDMAAGTVLTVFAHYNENVINFSRFTAKGGPETATAHGSFGAGTENVTISG